MVFILSPEIEMTKDMSTMLVYVTNENNKGDFIIDDGVGTKEKWVE